jgi:hypothetical protein
MLLNLVDLDIARPVHLAIKKYVFMRDLPLSFFNPLSLSILFIIYDDLQALFFPKKSTTSQISIIINKGIY